MASAAQVEVAQPSPLRQAGHRFLEASPGLVTWIMLFSPAWIPILFGTGGAIVVGVGVLGFDLYWLFRSYSIITGIYHTKGTYGGKPYEHIGRFTDTWVFDGGHWVCVASHTSLLKGK